MTDPRPVHRRDAALRRLARTRAGAVAGTASLTAVLGLLVAGPSSGRSGSAPGGAGPRRHTAAATLPPLASASALGLRAAPAPRAVRTPATTGGNEATGATAATATIATAATTAEMNPPTSASPPIAAAPAPASAPVVSGGS